MSPFKYLKKKIKNFLKLYCPFSWHSLFISFFFFFFNIHLALSAMQVLLGQKYGSCPLPASVVKSQFEAVRMHLVQNGYDVTLLDQCYLRDVNVVPSMYRLQNISKITGELGFF